MEKEQIKQSSPKASQTDPYGLREFRKIAAPVAAVFLFSLYQFGAANWQWNATQRIVRALLLGSGVGTAMWLLKELAAFNLKRSTPKRRDTPDSK